MTNSRKTEVLQDHRRVGSKFIPPLMDLPGGMKEVSYINNILPHVLWMGLINDRYGYKEGIKLVSEICGKAFELWNSKEHKNFSIVGNFELFDEKSKLGLKQVLGDSSILITIQECLSPLIKFYEDFPLSFLGLPDNLLSDKELLNTLKSCVETHIDKYEIPAMALQANVVYTRGVHGGLHVFKELEEPDLNSIITDQNHWGQSKNSHHVNHVCLY